MHLWDDSGYLFSSFRLSSWWLYRQKRFPLCLVVVGDDHCVCFVFWVVVVGRDSAEESHGEGWKGSLRFGFAHGCSIRSGFFIYAYKIFVGFFCFDCTTIVWRDSIFFFLGMKNSDSANRLSEVRLWWIFWLLFFFASWNLAELLVLVLLGRIMIFFCRLVLFWWSFWGVWLDVREI